jgi:hypothetical protein
MVDLRFSPEFVWEYSFPVQREPDVSEEHITSILRIEK